MVSFWVSCALAAYSNAAYTGGMSMIAAELEQAEIDEAWNTELRHRIDEVESGRAKLLNVAQVDARIDELLVQLRS